MMEALGALKHIVLSLLLTNLCGGRSQEVGPHRSVVAMVGDLVVLPCQLEIPMDAGKVTMEWGRPGLEPRFVYVWHEGQELLGDQNVVYEGRASVSVDQMKLGDISLKLSDVKHSDNGRYRCYTPKENKEHFVDLLVGSASPPGVSLAGLDISSSRVVLQCESAGWYPEPELYWRDSEGRHLSAGPTETRTGRDGLYTVSSRLTVEQRHGHSFTCRVQQRDINQTREALIHVPGDFFVASSTCAASISFSVIFCLLFTVTVAVFIWRWKFQPKELQKNEAVTKEGLSLMMERKLCEEASRTGDELKRTTQIIDSLEVLVKDLKNQKEQISTQTRRAEREAEEADGEFKSLDGEVEAAGDKTAAKAKGYTALKKILMNVIWQLHNRKKEHQQLEMNIEKLTHEAHERVTELTEKKQELETRMAELKKQMEKIKK